MINAKAGKEEFEKGEMERKKRKDERKEKKDENLRICHEQQKDFTPLVYTVDDIAGTEATSAEKKMVLYLAAKWTKNNIPFGIFLQIPYQLPWPMLIHQYSNKTFHLFTKIESLHSSCSPSKLVSL